MLTQTKRKISFEISPRALLRALIGLTRFRFNKIAIQEAPQMGVDKEAISLSRV